MQYRNLTRPPLERMLRIHDELNRGAPANCATLGKALAVSPKTIARDLAFMSARLDLPIDYDESKRVFRYTRPVAAFPTMQVTEGEVVALLIGRKALEQYRGTPFHRQLAASFAKITASLQNKISFNATDKLRTISFKSSGVGKSDVAVFNALSRALLRELEVEFDYRKPGEATPTQRRVQPYHFVHHDNLWYLIGFDLMRGELRTFAVPRVSAPRVTTAEFKRPADFDPEKFFAKAFGVFGGDGDYRVVVRFSAAVADRIREREWHDSQQLRELPDGGLELELRLGALPEIERWVLSWGAHARVMEPPELRERMKKTAVGWSRSIAKPEKCS